MSQLQALIFDVDGTLAETERDGHRVAFNRAFAAAGLDWDWAPDLYGELLAVSGGKERIQYYLEAHHSAFEPPMPLGNWIAQLHGAKTQHFNQLLQEGKIALRPGVRRLIESARSQGIRLAIATTSAPENAIALLKTALGPDSPDWFEVIAAGDIVAAKKPAPDIYHYVLAQMNLLPQACLVFEDSQHGLEAATTAGLKTVVTVNDYTHNQDFTPATLVLDHLGEPDQPFTAIAGEVAQATYFDLNLAQQLCSG